MNLTDLTEAFEIFKKYEKPNTYCPLSFDYGMIEATFWDTYMEAKDVSRLKELGWEVQQRRSSINSYSTPSNYEINDVEKGTYELYFNQD